MNLDTPEQNAVNATVTVALQRLCRRIKDHTQLYNDPLGVVNDQLALMLQEMEPQRQSWAARNGTGGRDL